MDILKKIELHLEEPYRLDGYEIVRLQLTGQKRKVLQVMIERLDAVAITLDDCEKVSRLTSILLDEIDLIKEAYVLEMSSAGIDRPLITPKHYMRYVGQSVSLYTHTLIKNRKKFIGVLEKADESGISLKVEEPFVDGSKDVDIGYSDIRSCKLKVDF
ncbi:MAG: Ribosome maturation factor RimP [Holosporales bacterium]